MARDWGRGCITLVRAVAADGVRILCRIRVLVVWRVPAIPVVEVVGLLLGLLLRRVCILERVSLLVYWRGLGLRQTVHLPEVVPNVASLGGCFVVRACCSFQAWPAGG